MTISEQDIYWFREGSHARLYEKLGAHWSPGGTRFAVWAPNAQSVSVIGDWNGWSAEAHPMQPRWDGSGLWETVIPGVQPGQPYKYRIVSRHHGYTVDKADPFAFHAEVPPATASRVWSLDYDWHDDVWMSERARRRT